MILACAVILFFLGLFSDYILSLLSFNKLIEKELNSNNRNKKLDFLYSLIERDNDLHEKENKQEDNEISFSLIQEL